MDGKALAERVRNEVAADVAGLGPIGLATVLVGDDPASDVYIRLKHKASTEVGIDSRDIRLPATTTEAELLEHVGELNADDSVHGILVQLPLPAGLDEAAIIAAIDPTKDVDGLHPFNAGQLLLGRPTFVGATPVGVLALLDEYDVELAGARAVVIGRSDIVGKPAALLLLQRHATVTICHSRTRDLGAEVASADVVVAAVGVPGLVAIRLGEGGRNRDRRRDHAHRGWPRRRRGARRRGPRRAPHARSRRGRADDDRDAPGERRQGRALPLRGACVSSFLRLCFARS